MAKNTLAAYKGVPIRIFLLYRHALGLWLGAWVSKVANLPPYLRWKPRFVLARLVAFFVRFFIRRELRKQPFKVHLRRRLELLGPTYVKFGQIMAIREDVLPKEITDELKQLLDNLPEVPFEIIKEIIEKNLGAPLETFFLDFEKKPIGSASIGQAHIAVTQKGKPVVVKVIKPGIREAILSDLKLLRMLAVLLEWIIPNYHPKNLINEFCRYTEREIDLTYEADNAELFAANFADEPDIVFPKIYRELSTRDVLCMQYLKGIKPNDPRVLKMSKAQRNKIIDLGTFAIIKMLYQDGFFHADLHAGNLIILPGPRVGFIDLGIAGRFEERIKRPMLYYFYALVNGDVESTARHLLSMARVQPGGDPAGFKRAVAELLRRYLLHASFGNYSLAKLIMESLAIGNQYRVSFPVEMTLMVKALVTFEGVGKHLDPHMNVPELSRKHIMKIFWKHYSPESLWNEFMRGLPALIDVAVQLPQLLSDSSRFVDQTVNEGGSSNPLAGLRSSLMAGACVVGGVLALVQQANPFLWGGLFAAGALFYWFGE